MFSIRQEIATIEEMEEILPNGTKVNGNLVLSADGEAFQFYWTIYDNSTNSWFKSIVSDPTNFASNKWEDHTSFLIDATKISLISFQQNPLRIIFNLGAPQIKREFIISNSNLDQFLNFIEHIIACGIALPTNLWKYSLEVYKRCHKSVFIVQPYHFHIKYNDDINKLFESIIQYSSDVICFYDKQKSIPNDPIFPISSLALVDVETKLNKIEKINVKKVEKDGWDSFFDNEGRFIKFDEVKNRCKIAGIDESLIKDFLPFITNVFSPNSTYEERKERTEKLVFEFKCLKTQSQTMSKQQKENNPLIGPYAKVIVQDVNRTDRDLKCFKNDGGQGLKILTDLLNCYLLYNPKVLYLQGMNDLFVPILLNYIPDWDENSNPINCDDIDEKLALVFWCYDGMLKSLHHTDLLSRLTDKMKYISQHAVSYISNVAPASKIWLKKSGNIELIFTYSDYVLLYKRSFHNIWRLWLFFLCFEKPQYALSLFTAAVVVAGLPQICTFKDWSITTMMAEYPRLIDSLDIDQVIHVAMWMFDENVIAPDEEQKKQNSIEESKKIIPDPKQYHFFKLAESF